MRLKQAESNLERLRDVLGQLGTQLANLRRQARHAQRYKELSAELRKCEAIQHHLLWTAASAQVETEEETAAAADAKAASAAAAAEADAKATTDKISSDKKDDKKK